MLRTTEVVILAILLPVGGARLTTFRVESLDEACTEGKERQVPQSLAASDLTCRKRPLEHQAHVSGQVVGKNVEKC